VFRTEHFKKWMYQTVSLHIPFIITGHSWITFASVCQTDTNKRHSAVQSTHLHYQSHKSKLKSWVASSSKTLLPQLFKKADGFSPSFIYQAQKKTGRQKLTWRWFLSKVR
jgi:hypothetical protein